MENIGKRIRIERMEKGITQNELARMLGMTQDSISLWEKGKRIPDTQYVISLCKVFGVSADYLLGLEDDFGVRVPAPVSTDILTAEEKKYIENLRQLSPNLRQLMSETLDTMVAESRKNL